MLKGRSDGAKARRRLLDIAAIPWAWGLGLGLRVQGLKTGIFGKTSFSQVQVLRTTN